METALEYLRFNLAPALLAGLLAWLVVQTGVTLLGIQHGKLRLCLFMAPLVKSTMVLLGLAAVTAWPVAPFQAWQARAVVPEKVLPVFLVATGLVLIGRSLLARRAARQILTATVADEQATLRLEGSVERVLDVFKQRRAHATPGISCESLPARPRVLVGDGTILSPTVVLAGEPSVVFPAAWLEQVDDDRALDGAMAHELAHLQIRRPAGCLSSEFVRALSILNPVAGLMSRQLELEEEKACDDVAVAVVGEPQTYAAMLLDGYRLASSRVADTFPRWGYAARLLGMRPAISERIERLLERPDDEPARRGEILAFVGMWIVLVGLFFSG